MDKLIKRGRRRPLFVPGETTQRVSLGVSEIERMLPHRDPFRFVDHIDHVDLEAQALVGRRTIQPHDPVFRGHFPGSPVYPGVLLIETMGQAGICLMHMLQTGRTTVREDDEPKALRLLKVLHAVFLGAVDPGVELTLVAKAVEAGDYTAICAGQILVDGVVKALAIQEVYVLEGDR